MPRPRFFAMAQASRFVDDIGLHALGERPAGEIGRGLHCIRRAPRPRRLAMRLHVAVAIGVEDAEFHRVHADEPRELVHLHFQREIADRHAEAAHGR